MSAELQAKVKRLEREMERLRTIHQGGKIYRPLALSDPPTDAELDGIFGTALYYGFSAAVFDSTDSIMWWVVWNQTGWYYVEMTKAV